MAFCPSAQSKQQAISSQQISENFTLAKFLAIILVSTGHYFDGSLLWVPVTVGLFVFAFASGYFTSIKHSRSLPLKAFWIAKLKRLGPPLIMINLFLGALFLVQGREGIWHPHTLLGITGLTGFLNWLGIQSQSPFGAGLWFLTVLLLFYVIYPLLAHAIQTRRAAIIFLLSSAVVCALGQTYAAPPYMLWPTIFGFCLGVVGGHTDWHPSLKLSILVGALTLFAMLVLNSVGFRQFNMLAIVVFSIATVAFLLSVPLTMAVSRMSVLTACVLEIYLIHGYLFIRPPAWSPWMSYLISMVMVFIVSIGLNFLAQRLSRLFEDVKQPVPATESLQK